MGVSPITHSELVSWCALHGTDLNSWEVEAILDMDTVTIGVINEKRAKS